MTSADPKPLSQNSMGQNNAATGSTPQQEPLIVWRLLSLFYDFWPSLALWMVLSVIFTAGYTLAGHGARENIPPLSAPQLALWFACWLVTGAYAVVSWRRGGQTLGMRPWRLRLVSVDDGVPGWGALARRYAVGTVSLLLGGLGFWWARFDREHLTWHDRASGTRLSREPRRT